MMKKWQQWANATVVYAYKSVKHVQIFDGRVRIIERQHWSTDIRPSRPNLLLFGPQIEFPPFKTTENEISFRNALFQAARKLSGGQDIIYPDLMVNDVMVELPGIRFCMAVRRRCGKRLLVVARTE